MIGRKRQVPDEPKIYHIVHVDRLPSIIADGFLWSDAEVIRRGTPGTAIGNEQIKGRRRTNLLSRRPDLRVGDCVPFYFCPRSPMLYAIHRNEGAAPDFPYTGGQERVVHLEADLHKTVAWAVANQLRWAFTLSNAGAYRFEVRSDLSSLVEIDWDAVEATDWQGRMESKQAEFLVERLSPWNLISFIGVHSARIGDEVRQVMRGAGHQPVVSVRRGWYY